MTFIIEEIPRNKDSVRYTTELTDIAEIRAWIRAHCDCSKRHVITDTPLGRVIAEGVQETVYFGWDKYHKKPKTAVVSQLRTLHQGFDAFTSEDAAAAHYQHCLRIANAKLDKDEALARTMLATLAEQGVEFSANADASDDTGLHSWFAVSCTVSHFYFSRPLDD